MTVKLAGVTIFFLILLGSIYVKADANPMQATSSSLEEIMSQRMSMRSYTTENVTNQQLLEVLRAAYGYWGDHRSTPQTGSDRALVTFAINATGSYQYIPENNTLVVYDRAVNKETIRPYDQGYPSDASAVLIPVWNQTRMGNKYFASAEAGCFVQNAYMAAISLGLGTVCVGGIYQAEIGNLLELPSKMTPMVAMPIGYLSSSYPSAFPDYSRMYGNLPTVQFSDRTFGNALDNMLYAQAWSPENLSLQELSQLLWASYGYSSTGHRTTPSAYDIYPLQILVLNATGVYRYTPGNHSVTETLVGDKRLDVENIFNGQNWATNAPALFLVIYDSAYNNGWTGDDEGLLFDHEFIEINAGTVIQNILLEASAWNLSGNISGEGLQDWNGTGAQEIRDILSLPSTLIPLYSVPIGHRLGYDLNLRVKDWGLTNDIQGALVYKDSDVKTSDANGWANWTDVTGTVAIKVSWFGQWVNGTFSITMDSGKTIDIRSNIFDIAVTCVEQINQAILQNANVTATASGNIVTSGFTGPDGRTILTNVPNGTLTLTAYDSNNNEIANATRTIASEGQTETLTCDKNYVNIQSNWQITEVWMSASLLYPSLLLIMGIGLPWSFEYLERGMKTIRFRNKDNK